MDDQRADHFFPEGTAQGNHPKKLHTHKLLSDDLENINRKKKEEIY